MAGHVLLTGATGFLGAHLLHELLERGDAPVTCLVRGGGDGAARQALEQKLAWYFPGWQAQRHGSRLRVVAGDIGAPALGLGARCYDGLAEACSLVINSAANVSHIGAASSSFRVNTDGVAGLIDFCRRGASKALHQISTVSVQGQASGGVFDETQLEQGQTFRNAYGESKYRAEVLMRRAFAEGLRGAIYRVGHVGPHSVSGRFQQNIQQSHIALYLRACIVLGFAPHLPHARLVLTPVDAVARGILALARRSDGRGRTFYVISPHALALGSILRVLHAAGYAIRLMDPAELAAKAARLSRDEEALATLSAGRAGAEPAFDCSASLHELARAGMEFPRPTSDWLAKFLGHAIEEGFLEAPRLWNAAAMVSGLF